MRVSARFGSTVVGSALAIAALSMFQLPAANADTVVVNPADYMIGDTVYFTYGNLAYCAMHSNGDVGCDIANGTMNWYGFQVSNISIDLPFLPAHPAFGPVGTHGVPGSAVLSGGGAAPGSNNPYGPDASITYGGATCTGSGFRGEVSCASKGHQFSFGFTTSYS